MDAIKTSVVTALADIQSNAVSLIGDVLPYALGVMAIGVVVSIGVKLFKRFAK